MMLVESAVGRQWWLQSTAVTRLIMSPSSSPQTNERAEAAGEGMRHERKERETREQRNLPAIRNKLVTAYEWIKKQTT